MRVTDKMLLTVATQGQRKTMDRLVRATRVASSGLKVERPSDDPVAFAGTVSRDARDGVVKARKEVAERAANDLQVAEGVLNQAGDMLIRARELVLGAANETVSAEMRATVGQEVRGLRTALIGLANSRGANGYLFGGSRSGTAPVSENGVFSGNPDEVRVDVSDGVSVRTNASGARAFTALGGLDLFTEMGNIADALERNDLVAVRRGINLVDALHKQVRAVQVDAGLDTERLRSAGDVLSNALAASTEIRARDVEGDVVEAYSALTVTRDAYTRNVEVTKQILQLSSMQR